MYKSLNRNNDLWAFYYKLIMCMKNGVNVQKTGLSCIITLLMLVAIINCKGTIITVSQNGTAEYTVIQQAINASANSDTVLVMPGTYLENLNLNGRNITLASNNLMTGDPAYIYTTILDGNHAGPVIKINTHETHVTIHGFSIMNGSGNLHNSINKYCGGGLFVYSVPNFPLDISVKNCIIKNNYAQMGGGMYLYARNSYLEGTVIKDNEAEEEGGGIYYMTYNYSVPLSFSSTSKCSIYSNYGSNGADMFADMTTYIQPVILDSCTVMNPWNYFFGARKQNVNDPNPNPYTFNILHAAFQEINHDMYVAPWGDDNNSGLTESEPMKTIAFTVYKIAADSLNPKTVHLAPGVYSPSLNGQKLPLPIKRYMSLVGNIEETTIIDAENLTGVIRSGNDNQKVVIRDLTLKNCKYGINAMTNVDLLVENVTIKDLPDATFGALFIGYCNRTQFNNVSIYNSTSSNSNGGAIYISHNKESVILKSVSVSNCSSSEWMPPISIGDGGDIILDGCHFSNNANNSVETSNSIFQIGTTYDNVDYLRVKMTNCLFDNNYQANMTQMASIMSLGTISSVENCTFVDNTGGSNTIVVNGNFTLKNNLFYNTSLPYEIVIPNLTNNGLFSNVWLDYNDIRNGQSGVYNATTLNHLYWGVGNISVNPLFSGGESTPYYLSAASPLIDTGSPELSIGHLAYDLAGNARIWDGDGDGVPRIDIGAYEYRQTDSPADLTARLATNTVHLSWSMQMNRNLSGYRVYRDSVAIADIDSSQALDYIDQSFTQSDTLTYFVVALYGTVESPPSNPVTVYLEYVQAEDDLAPALTSFSISPNPFIHHTVVRYTLKHITPVEITVYNLKGQKIQTITQQAQSKGEYVTAWDGSDEQGKPVSSGIYIIRLLLDGKQVSSRKVTLVR